MKIYLGGLIFSILLLLGQAVLVSVLPLESSRINVNMVALMVVSLASIPVLGYTAWQTRRFQPRLFPSWLMLFLAMVCNPVAGIVGVLNSWLFGAYYSPLFLNYFVLIVYPLYFMMIALLPSRSTRRLELIQWLFDALVVVGSITLVFWVFWIQPSLLGGYQNLDQHILSLAYAAGDLLVLWALVMILFRRLSEQQAGPLWWLFGAFSLLLAYDLITSSLEGFSSLTIYGTLREVLLSACLLSISVAGLRQLLALSQPIPGAGRYSLAGWWETARLMMPYLGLGASFGILILSLIRPQALSPLMIAIWVSLILLLVILRQVLVIRENRRLSGQLFQLNAELEQRVVERTEALITANQELQEREIRMAHNALHDALTGLPNRALLIDRLEHSIRRARRDPRYSFGILFMDLDGFKVINDSLGHSTGDRLLIKIAHNLKSCMREVDTVARLGGDEFVILLDGCAAEKYLVDAAQRVMDVFAAPYEVEAQFVYMAASMGIVPGIPDYAEPADILRDADLAMYEAKALGKARYVVFTPELRASALDRLMLEKDLRLAMEKSELHLNYQPILNLVDGTVLGFEALLRWRHASLGMISPGTFVPIAEANGMIIPITFWVLGEAVQQLAAWKRQFPGIPLSIAVNLSARLFSQPDLMHSIDQLLAAAQLPPADLVLEITESAIIQDASVAIKILQACRDMGIRVHMDDFGTGYSSLSYLHNFPLNALKVAQDFVMRILPGGENSEIVRTIVTLARDLGLEVIAEGIETPEQMEYIRRLGCQGGQGFYISRPLGPEEAGRFISRHSIKQIQV
jgi:diguanylate cyclase (GGDEF)-like protein